MPNTHGGPEPLEKHLEQGYRALSWSDGGASSGGDLKTEASTGDDRPIPPHPRVCRRRPTAVLHLISRLVLSVTTVVDAVSRQRLTAAPSLSACTLISLPR